MPIGELCRNGVVARLQPQPLQVLLAMLRRPSQIVTREELRASLWPENTNVEFDDGLNHAIRRLRSALGDTAQVPCYIETIPRRGYRFIATVEMATPGQLESKAEPASALAPTKPGPSWLMPVLVFAVVLVLAFGIVFSVRQRRLETHIESIAVLPMANFSSDPDQELFADAITEELTTELARIKSLRVISRTSAMRLKGAKLSLQEIGRELGVDAVIEGSVQRSGDRVRISAQLVRVPSERHLWAETYERSYSDRLRVRSEVGLDIVSQLRAEIVPLALAPAKVRPPVPEAYDAYLIAMRFFDEGTLEGYGKSIPYFEEAVRKDPNYVIAYGQLAEAHGMIAFTQGVRGDHLAQALASARKVMELDPTLPEAQIREADPKFYWDWDWSQCDGPFRRAAQAAIESMDVQYHYALCLEVLGRFNEALPYMENARKLDPLSPRLNIDLGRLLARTGQIQKGLEYLNKARDLEPNNPAVYETLAWTYDKQSRQAEAVEARIMAGRLRGDLPARTEEALMNAFRTGGITAFQHERSKFLKVRIETLKRQPDVPPLNIAAMYVRSGEFDQAFRWLDQACDQRVPMLVWLKSGTGWEPLRDEPRYRALLKKMNMPE